ncbi:hypothetical protein QUB05_12390 [Microcoleus sp. F10-C6]
MTSSQPTPNLVFTFTPAECDAAGYRYQRQGGFILREIIVL